MLSRALAALGVGVWCFFVLFAALGFVIDRGLANSPWTWLAVLGIGVVAPAIFMRQINRAIALHEESRRAVPGMRERERELLTALEERGEITPATAAMRTSLTIEEAARMLEKLASKGHLKVVCHDGALSYSFFERDCIENPEQRDNPGAQELSSGASAVPAANGSANGSAHEAVKPLLEPLSERELEVLTLLASGRTNREISRDLFVTVGTIKSHTSNIYRKLDARNRTQALSRARELNLI